MRELGSVSLHEKTRIRCGQALAASYVLVAIAAVIPYGSKVQSISVASMGLDKIVHFVCFACMALLTMGFRQFLNRRAFSLLLFLFGFGVLIEFVQYYLPYRSFNPFDIMANLLGVVFGVLVAFIAIYAKKALEGEQGRR